MMSGVQYKCEIIVPIMPLCSPFRQFVHSLVCLCEKAVDSFFWTYSVLMSFCDIELTFGNDQDHNPGSGCGLSRSQWYDAGIVFHLTKFYKWVAFMMRKK